MAHRIPEWFDEPKRAVRRGNYGQNVKRSALSLRFRDGKIVTMTKSVSDSLLKLLVSTVDELRRVGKALATAKAKGVVQCALPSP